MRNPKLAAMIAATFALMSCPAFADVKSGVAAWERGDFDTAAKAWRPLAIAGDADAQFNLAQAYRFGRGVPADLPLAEDWYRKAAAQGHVQAEDNLGLIMFQNGDRGNALPYIRRSADRGDARAQYVLGTALFNGDIVPKDWPTAYAYMVRASSTGLARASAHLAQMDKYVSMEDRQKGLVLARDLEARTNRPQTALQSIPLPASSAQFQASGADYASAAPVGVKRAPPPPLMTANRSALPPPPQAPAATQADMTLPPAAVWETDRADMPPLADLPSALPDPMPAPVARPAAPIRHSAPQPAAQSGAWRVQLGAFGQEGNARALWTSAKAHISALSGLQPYLVKSGAVTRLQAGPVRSKSQAVEICADVRAAGQDCLVIAP